RGRVARGRAVERNRSARAAHGAGRTRGRLRQRIRSGDGSAHPARALRPRVVVGRRRAGRDLVAGRQAPSTHSTAPTRWGAATGTGSNPCASSGTTVRRTGPPACLAGGVG